jgi:hypothetical protein
MRQKRRTSGSLVESTQGMLVQGSRIIPSKVHKFIQKFTQNFIMNSLLQLKQVNLLAMIHLLGLILAVSNLSLTNIHNSTLKMILIIMKPSLLGQYLSLPRDSELIQMNLQGQSDHLYLWTQKRMIFHFSGCLTMEEKVGKWVGTYLLIVWFKIDMVALLWISVIPEIYFPLWSQDKGQLLNSTNTTFKILITRATKQYKEKAAKIFKRKNIINFQCHLDNLQHQFILFLTYSQFLNSHLIQLIKTLMKSLGNLLNWIKFWQLQEMK